MEDKERRERRRYGSGGKMDKVIIGASLSEPHLVRTMISLSLYIYKERKTFKKMNKK